MRFSSANVYWIENSHRLAIVARPRAGDWLEDEIAGWKDQNVDTVVSLLEDGEISELGLEREPALCAANGIEFISFPIADRGVPRSSHSFEALVRELTQRIVGGEAVAIHCRAGIGRSSLVAACVLVSAGMDASDALGRIGIARGVQVPDTEEQRAWILRYRPIDHRR